MRRWPEITDLHLASGLGLALVEYLIGKGWNVTVFDFNNAREQELKTKFGNQLLFTTGDVSKYVDQAKAFVETFRLWKRLDLGKVSAVLV